MSHYAQAKVALARDEGIRSLSAIATVIYQLAQKPEHCAAIFESGLCGAYAALDRSQVLNDARSRDVKVAWLSDMAWTMCLVDTHMLEGVHVSAEPPAAATPVAGSAASGAAATGSAVTGSVFRLGSAPSGSLTGSGGFLKGSGEGQVGLARGRTKPKMRLRKAPVRRIDLADAHFVGGSLPQAAAQAMMPRTAPVQVRGRKKNINLAIPASFIPVLSCT